MDGDVVPMKCKRDATSLIVIPVFERVSHHLRVLFDRLPKVPHVVGVRHHRVCKSIRNLVIHCREELVGKQKVLSSFADLLEGLPFAV